MLETLQTCFLCLLSISVTVFVLALTLYMLDDLEITGVIIEYLESRKENKGR